MKKMVIATERSEKKVVAFQVKTENGTWGPPFVSKSVADWFVQKGFKVRKLVVLEGEENDRDKTLSE